MAAPPGTPQSPPARLGKDKESWDVLLVEERAAAEKLGWTPESWEDGDPPVCASAWEMLDAEQRAAATALGYERVIWDLEEAAGWSDEDIVIKISDGKDIRRFTASTESMPISYSTIYENLPEAFVLGSKAYKLKYKDDEGDQITMSTDRDLANAVAYTKTLEPPVLRLTLEAESLELAIIEGNVDVVKALLESGAPLEEMKRRCSDGSHITPLELAIAKGNVDVVNALLKSRAPLEGMKRFFSDGSHMTPLDLAIAIGNVDVVNAVLEAAEALGLPLDDVSR